MRSNEELTPTPEEIARQTAEFRRNWTPTEEYRRRVVKGKRRVELRELSRTVSDPWAAYQSLVEVPDWS